MYSGRSEIAAAILERLARLEATLRSSFASSGPVRHFVVDDLLDREFVAALRAKFPDPRTLLVKSSLRERKRVGVRIDRYHPSIGDALLAFQDPAVVSVIARITGHLGASADPTLYASGISVMRRGDFLNPHIDNSHDGDRKRYRVLNLLFYVSPDWRPASGGNLELWDDAVRTAHVVEAKFNRLVVMETHRRSWHSVNAVRVPFERCCVSNYYFSEAPPGGVPYSNVTTFTGRPEQPIRRVVLGVLDGIVLNAIGHAMPWLTMRNKHRLRPSSPR